MLDLYREAFKYIDDEPDNFEEPNEPREESKSPKEECPETLEVTDLSVIE